MMNLRAVWMLIVAVVLGLAVTLLAVGWVSSKGAIQSGKVVVAAVDIELGSRLGPQMLAAVDWPSSSIPKGAFSELKPLEDRVVKTTVIRGEAVIEAKLAPIGAKGGLSAVIAEGKRAMTVRVNDVIGVAGFALPGNYVDVMVNTQQDAAGKSAQGEHISRTVLQHVLVLAVAQEASRDETKPKVVSAVTLELTPEDAEKLDLARNVGTLSLVLRNQVDEAPVTTEGITKEQLFGAKPMPDVKAAPAVASPKPVVRVAQSASRAPVTPPPRMNCVEVIHDNKRRLACF